MLSDCLAVFEKQLEKEERQDQLILDSYILSDGTYIIVKVQGDRFEMSEPIPVKLDKKTGEINQKANIHLDKLKAFDYYSRLLDMNKPIDKKKIIHSNNYLSFSLKKENLFNGKLNQEIIEDYYKILANPEIKYDKDKNSRAIYQKTEEELGKVDVGLLEKIKGWIEANIFQLDIELSGKDYLKIFFDYPLDLYREEGKRYILPNIYNNNNFNLIFGNEIYGLPNNNLGLNAKKPYLENHSRKVTVPHLLSMDQALFQKKFFDYLMNLASAGKYNVYINQKDNIVEGYKNGEGPKKDLYGYFLRIQKGKKEAEIIYFDTISDYRNDLKEDLLYENLLGLEPAPNSVENGYGSYKTLKNLEKLVNEIFFSHYLINNYFTDPKDISIKDGYLLNSLLVSRNILRNWFSLNKDNGVEGILEKISLDLIKGSISNGYLNKATLQFNLRWSLKGFFNQGGKNMAEFMLEKLDSLRKKINPDESKGNNVRNEEFKIHSDTEYYIAVGQLVSYFISLSKSSKKTHSLANPFFNAKNNKIIKEMLANLYIRYNYMIDYNSKRASKLYALIANYEPEGKVDQDMIIAGFLNSNLIYEKA